MNVQQRNKIPLVWGFLFLLFFLSACGGGGDSSEDPILEDPTTQSVTVRFTLPSELQSASRVDLERVYPRVVINGELSTGYQASLDGFWSRVKTVLRSDVINTITITWMETYASEELILGESETQLTVSSTDSVVTVDQTSFSSAYDRDSDGVSNLDEIEAGTNPLEADTSNPRATVSLRVTVPDVEYEGGLRQLSVSATWNGLAITMTNGATDSRVFTGSRVDLIPGDGILVVSVRTSDNKRLYDYERDQLSISRGENSFVVNAEDFSSRPITMNVSVAIPDRDYRGGYVVQIKGVKGSTFTTMNGSGRSFRSEFNGVALGRKTVDVQIKANNQSWVWATARKTYEVVAGGNSLSFAASDFNFNIDSDGDGINNIDDPNPAVAPSPEPEINLRIPYANNGTPGIDGIRDSAWDAAIGSDTSGTPLWIDNLMIERRSAQGSDNDDYAENDGAPEHRWWAMYDNQYLYILVLSKNDHYISCDSANAWDDDNVNIYWDGDNSKGTSYDGRNDFHALIPLLERDSCSHNHGSRIEQGARSSTLPAGGDLSFATSGTPDAPYYDYYEVRIRLSSAKITVGEPFGIDIHIDDDDDDGARDQKWGWYHRSRGNADVDDTYRNPSVMATAILE